MLICTKDIFAQTKKNSQIIRSLSSSYLKTLNTYSNSRKINKLLKIVSGCGSIKLLCAKRDYLYFNDMEIQVDKKINKKLSKFQKYF